MNNCKIIVKDYFEIEPQNTSHNIGAKTVLLSKEETSSHITQIAVTKLSENEQVEFHIHNTMDEHYLFMEGEGVLCVANDKINCRRGVYVLVPSKTPHSMTALSDLTFLTLGIAVDVDA